MTRLLYSMAEAAEQLDISIKTLRAHCNAREIRYVLVGKRTRKFTDGDLQEFIENRRELCPSTSRKTRLTGTSISRSRVYDFTARRERRSTRRHAT